MIELRRIFDFIMGTCAGFCFFYGEFIGIAIGTLMLLTFVITSFREKMLKSIDKDLEKEKC